MQTYIRSALVIAVLAGSMLAVTALTSPHVRAAGPWYVAPGGSDSNDCLSPTTPCVTINGALNKPGFAAGDTIRVAIGTYTGAGNEVVLLSKNAVLSGGWISGFTAQTGSSIIDGQAMRRGVWVNSEIASTITRFIIQNGTGGAGGTGGIVNSGGSLVLDRSIVRGNAGNGGISNGGILTVTNSAIDGNVGIGIYNSIGSRLTLYNSTVSGNTNEWAGGGIYNDGIATLNNSTVSGNIAPNGGGIYNRWQGIGDNGSLYLNNSTITGNTATSGNGGGIDSSGVLILNNSILAGNTGPSGPDCSGQITSSSYSLVGSTSGCTFVPGTGDLTNVSANLGQLIGSPGYHPLLSGSPAINAGNPAGCIGSTGLLTTDQRGASRVGQCDMGAYEYTTPGSPASIVVYGGTPQRATPSSAFAMPLRAVVMDSIGSPVNDTAVTFAAPGSGASGTFAASGTATTTVNTNASGIVTTTTFTANALPGSYAVTATVSGVSVPASFFLANVDDWYVAPAGNDDDDCLTAATTCASIRAVMGKIHFAPGDTIRNASGSYTGTGAEVVLVNKSAIFSGGWNASFSAQNGSSTLDGQGVRRGITVDSGATAVVERFTVQGGSSSVYGGGIANLGTLTVNNAVIQANTASDMGGGGIFNAGILTLNNSTVIGNSATQAGGINNGGTMTLNNSAVSGNSATFSGGGGIFNHGTTLILNNSTVSGNSVPAIGFYSFGGGIYNGSGSLILNNSTVSNNSALSVDGGAGGIYANGYPTLRNSILAGNWAVHGPDCTGFITSGGYNLVGNTSECTWATGIGDLLNVDARLFPLTGSPGYHPLLPGSPAIDAGNPAGCLGSAGALTTDQRGAARPVDGNVDGSAICDIGAYEFDPNNNPITQVFLPTTARNYCPDFFDNFSNPASGWAVVDDSFVRSEYLNGEFRILSKQAGYFYFFRAPTCNRQNYVVEADARWVGAPGESHGLIFGITGDFDRLYLFDVNTDFRQYRLLRFDGDVISTIVPSAFSPAIQGGTASNHLKVTRNNDQITLVVNGTVLGTWSDGSITGLTGVGVVSRPYDGSPTSDARFDNFSVTGLPGSSVAMHGLSGSTPEADGSHIFWARHATVPVGIDWWLPRDDVEMHSK